MAEALALRGWFRDRRPVLVADAARAMAAAPGPERVSERAKTRAPLHSRGQVLALIFCFAPLWEIAEQIEAEIAAAEANRAGRRRAYPIMALLIWDVALWVYGSARAVDRELQDPRLWRTLRRAVKRAWPDRRRWRLPKRPISRSQYHRGRERHLKPRDAQLTAWAEKVAAEAAVFMGMLETAADPTRPLSHNTVYGDATWVKALLAADPRPRLDTATGELVLPRCDPDARPYHTHTGTGVGHQAVLALIRGPHPGERIILSALLNHPGRSDATAFTDKILELAERDPRLAAGLTAAVYDGALHAPDMIRLLNAGVVPVAKVHHNQGGAPAAANLGPADITLPDGTRTTAELAAVDGTPAIISADHAGRPAYIPLIRTKTRIRRNKHHPAAVNTRWRIPTTSDNPESAALAGPLTGATLGIRHNPPNPREALRINRALRVIPPSDDDYDRLYGLREDAESTNNHLKERLRHGRAPTIGTHRLQLNLTGYQIHTLITALTNWHHRTGGDITRWFGQHQPP